MVLPEGEQVKPGSLRIVSHHPVTGERNVYKFGPGKADEERFYRQYNELFEDSFKIWLYEMTDRGWTEF